MASKFTAALSALKGTKPEEPRAAAVPEPVKDESIPYGPHPVTDYGQPKRKPGRPPGKRTDPRFAATTVYLEKDTRDDAADELKAQRRRDVHEHDDLSDLVNFLLRVWLRTQETGEHIETAIENTPSKRRTLRRSDT